MSGYVELPSSTFMDYNSNNSNAPGPPKGGQPLGSIDFDVALILKRQHDPTELLQSDWGARQAALADQAHIWSLYGADPAGYQAVQDVISGLGLNLAPAADGYVASAPSRTVWVQLTGDSDFYNLFHAHLFGTDDGKLDYWADAARNPINLSLPQALIDAGVEALQFDRIPFRNYVVPQDLEPAGLLPGAQSVGSAAGSAHQAALYLR